MINDDPKDVFTQYLSHHPVVPDVAVYTTVAKIFRDTNGGSCVKVFRFLWERHACISSQAVPPPFEMAWVQG